MDGDAERGADTGPPSRLSLLEQPTKPGNLVDEAGIFALKGQYPFDAFEVDSGIRELLYEKQAIEVFLAVSPGPARRPVRVEESATLVHAQGLWVHADELCSDRDDVDGVLLFVHVTPLGVSVGFLLIQSL